MALLSETGDRLILTDAEGRALARMRSDAPRSAYDVDLEAGAPLEAVAAEAATALAGWHLGAPPELAHALTTHGARLGRHAHLHSRDLRAEPPPRAWGEAPPPEGTRFAPVRGVDPDLADAMGAAYPLGHPDRESEAPLDTLVGVVSGPGLGPLLPCSGVLLAADGRACAGVLITARPGTPPWAGPWLTEVFRHPERAPRGAGRILLARALATAAADGLAALSLVVTEGNPARRVYDALGLRRVTTTINVTLP